MFISFIPTHRLWLLQMNFDRRHKKMQEGCIKFSYQCHDLVDLLTMRVTTKTAYDHNLITRRKEITSYVANAKPKQQNLVFRVKSYTLCMHIQRPENVFVDINMKLFSSNSYENDILQTKNYTSLIYLLFTTPRKPLNQHPTPNYIITSFPQFCKTGSLHNAPSNQFLIINFTMICFFSFLEENLVQFPELNQDDKKHHY